MAMGSHVDLVVLRLNLGDGEVVVMASCAVTRRSR